MMRFWQIFFKPLARTGNCCGKAQESPAVVALAGHPNVGKSTVFNRLTGLHQHTGNWCGKTVATAEGFFERNGQTFRLVDLPGTVSYAPHSAEEEAAAAFLRSGGADAVVVVCDAGCLTRGISFVLQTAELADNIIVCVNLTDEAEKRGIRVDTRRLSHLLGMPVVAASASRGKGMEELAECIAERCGAGKKRGAGAVPYVKYPAPIEAQLRRLEAALAAASGGHAEPRHFRSLAIRLLTAERAASEPLPLPEGRAAEIAALAEACRAALADIGLDCGKIAASVASSRLLQADTISEQCVSRSGDHNTRAGWDRRLDRIFTGKITGRLCMLLLLAVVFWLTITGANAPSAWLSAAFGKLEGVLRAALEACRMPPLMESLLMEGVYRVLTWIIAVMLPPMAIFFPLFTLLEDAGYLPRAAFNLDHSLQRCGACGKQALTACMGFGCNAVGVTGCRIIDSPRERIMAILTNSFIPCNGRFPILTALIAMFFLGSVAAPLDSLLGALLLTGLIGLGLAASFGVSKLLSVTLLRGTPSAFALELPPFRKPRIGSVLLHSVTDRTLFVLGRAAAVAAPAGAVIWLTAHVTVGGNTLLHWMSGFLDPLGRILGMDGVILMAFLLGLPANEIVIPLMIMAYTAQGSMTGIGDPAALHDLFVSHGWTPVTALCVMLFTLMHSPCATTCLTIYKETNSLKWTALSIAIPTLTGCAVCAAVAAVAGIMP